MIGDRIPRQAYLQLSEPYARAADEAERRGWPTRRESADHLAMLTQPELVVGHLVRLLWTSCQECTRRGPLQPRANGVQASTCRSGLHVH